MTTYEENKVQLVVNRMDNDCYGHLSSKSNEEIYIVSSNPSGVVKIDLDAVTMVQADVQSMSSALDLTNSHVSALESRMGEVSASVSALGSSVADLNAKLLDKRDYIDLKYPALAQDGDNRFGISSWSYSFPVQGIGYQGTLNNYTWDGEYGEWSYDNYSPKVRTSDGQNFQFASAQAFDTGWTDPLALSQVYPQAIVSLQIDVAHGQMNCELTPSFASTTTLALTNYVDAQVSAMGSSISANASAISANTSAISAMASNFTVSGIGCSTIVLSGTYSDSTSFAYNFVIQPSA